MIDLTLPLMDNEVALLRVPTPLTEDNFEYLMQQIGLLKRGLVSRAVPAPSAPAVLAPNGAPAGQESGVTLELRHKLLARGMTPHEIVTMTAEQAEAELAKLRGK